MHSESKQRMDVRHETSGSCLAQCEESFVESAGHNVDNNVDAATSHAEPHLVESKPAFQGRVIPFPLSPVMSANASHSQLSSENACAIPQTSGVLFFSPQLATLLDEHRGSSSSLRESCEADGILCYPFSESKFRNALRGSRVLLLDTVSNHDAESFTCAGAAVVLVGDAARYEAASVFAQVPRCHVAMLPQIVRCAMRQSALQNEIARLQSDLEAHAAQSHRLNCVGDTLSIERGRMSRM
jgi:hypothetical protein